MFALLDRAPAVANEPGAAPLALTEAAVAFEDVTFGGSTRMRRGGPGGAGQGGGTVPDAACAASFAPGILSALLPVLLAALTSPPLLPLSPPAYAPDLPPVLRGLSFRAPGGTCLALVGATGSGKSSAVRLLLRFWDPAVGRVLVDGQDIRACNLASVRGCMAVVPQDAVLFNDTLAHNIRCVGGGCGCGEAFGGGGGAGDPSARWRQRRGAGARAAGAEGQAILPAVRPCCWLRLACSPALLWAARLPPPTGLPRPSSPQLWAPRCDRRRGGGGGARGAAPRHCRRLPQRLRNAGAPAALLPFSALLPPAVQVGRSTLALRPPPCRRLGSAACG